MMHFHKVSNHLAIDNDDNTMILVFFNAYELKSTHDLMTFVEVDGVDEI